MHTCEADPQNGHLHCCGEAQEVSDVVLEYPHLGHHQAHTDDDLIEPIKVSQVSSVLIAPQIDGVVYREPGPAYLRQESHTAVTLEVYTLLRRSKVSSKCSYFLSYDTAKIYTHQ